MLQRLNRYIDHTLLRPDATAQEIAKLCEEARRYDFRSVCVQPVRVAQAVQLLRGSRVHTCTVIGFPTGAHAPSVKARETEIAYQAGCDEFDMVINVGALKDGDEQSVYFDIRSVVEAAHGCLVKVIIETFYLNDDQKLRAGMLAYQAGADYVKTCTGFNAGVATVEDIRLLRAGLPAHMKLKASGGIRSLDTALALIKAGADRLGCSAGAKLMEEAKRKGEGTI